jgi:hypothetical protein
MKTRPGLFLSGSGRGRICCGDISKQNTVVYEYPLFDKLTSIHTNCSNDRLLISGYSTNVALFDIETGANVSVYEGIHKDHINISRFTNLSPNLFGTSSFDGTIKLWDLRQKHINTPIDVDSGYQGQIYTLHCKSGVVMINISADDSFLLASAQDNEINQYTLLDGQHNSRCNVTRTGLTGNFTRAYYSASGRHTITGACEQNSVKLLCTYTGNFLTSVSMTPIMRDPSIYVQSLRGSPHDDFRLCVLCNYRDISARELVLVTGSQEADPLPACSQREELREDFLLQGKKTMPLAIPSYQYLNDMFQLRIKASQASIHPCHRQDGLVLLQYCSALSDGPDRLDIQAVHGFVLLARCPTLLKWFLPSSITPCTAHVAHLFSQEEWALLPLVVDYLYVGLAALELVTFKRYALRLLSSSSKAELVQSHSSSLEHWDQLECSLAFDDCLWRSSAYHARWLLDIIFKVYELCMKLELEQCCLHVEWLLSTMLSPMTAFGIWRWSQQRTLPALQEACEMFIAAHHVSALLLYPELSSHDLQAIILRVYSVYCVEVVSKHSFALRISDLNDWLAYQQPSSKQYIELKQVEQTWRNEEAPLIPKMGPFNAITCLPAYLWHGSCTMLDRYILFMGGMSGDRLNSFTRVLVYDTVEDRFGSVRCGGVDLPASAYMHGSITLQKQRARHVVLFGGKLRHGEVGCHTPPMHRNTLWSDSTSVPNPIEHDTEEACTIYELDYGALTWSLKTVTIQSDRFTRFASLTGTESEHRIASSLAFRKRIAQSVVAIYPEDIPYRCQLCLFQNTSHLRTSPCRHDLVAATGITWALQFGGYCPEHEVMDDLHVLSCIATAAGGGYRYEWRKVSASGTSPAGRFSHVAAFLPAGSQGSRYARMLSYGGVTQTGVSPGAASLRINMIGVLGDDDVAWERVSTTGTAPSRLHGHTLTHITGSNVCIVIGGAEDAINNRGQASDKIWCLRIQEVEDLHVQLEWSLLSYVGEGPSARSRHTCNLVNCETEGSRSKVLFVFGGLHEAHVTGDQESSAVETKARDSIMHRLHWNGSGQSEWLDRAVSSKVLLLQATPPVSAPTCHLGKDMRQLLTLSPMDAGHGAFQPDLRFIVDAEDDHSSAVIPVFSSLIAQRCPMVRVLLSAGMVESQTGVIRLPPDTPLEALKQVLAYLSADYLSLTTVQQTVQVLELANMYSLGDVVKMCEGALLQLVNSATVYDLLCYAETYALELLRAACYAYILRGDGGELAELLSSEENISSAGEAMESMYAVDADEMRSASQLPLEVKRAFALFATDSMHVYKHNLPSAGDAL